MSDKVYYWIQAIDPHDGRMLILGAYESEDQANQIGFEKIKGVFEVVPLNTKDGAKATQLLKHRRLVLTSRLDDATKMARHKPKEGGEYAVRDNEKNKADIW